MGISSRKSKDETSLKTRPVPSNGNQPLSITMLKGELDRIITQRRALDFAGAGKAENLQDNLLQREQTGLEAIICRTMPANFDEAGVLCAIARQRCEAFQSFSDDEVTLDTSEAITAVDNLLQWFATQGAEIPDSFKGWYFVQESRLNNQ